MKLDRIQQWAPFLYRFINYDNKPRVITFTCPKCGGHNCEKIGSLEPDNFWSGNYRCTDCGNRRDGNGNEINYYSDCFHNDDEQKITYHRPVDDSEVAELCLKCEYRPSIYMLGTMPFCDRSSTTCARRHGKKKCSDYLRKQPKQLSLFE